MRVLLIDPPYDKLIRMKSEWFPLGLLNIATFLNEQTNIEVRVYNAEHTSKEKSKYLSVTEYSKNIHLYKEACENRQHHIWKEIYEVIENYHPDIVGISVLTPKLTSALRIAEIAKEFSSKIIVVCGNHHATARPNDILSHKCIDFLVRGEGEHTFHELIKALIEGNEAYKDTKGLSYKINGTIINNELRGLIPDLDSLPVPNRRLLMESETYSNEQLSMVMTSRGCPFNCGFCASSTIWRRKVRFRSIEHIYREIRELGEDYGIRNITFMDDSFTVNSRKVVELCNALIADKINITWSCLTRVDIISDSLIALMKKSGCTKIVVGIESGNERILQFINKNTTLNMIRNAVGILRRHNMFWAGFFLFGLPTETEAEILDTLSFMREIRPDWAHVSMFTPYPGTTLYDYCRENKIIGDNVNYDKYTHQCGALDFSGQIPKKRGDELALYLLREFHNYNSSIRSLTKRALSRKYYKKPSLIISDIKKMISWLNA